MAVTVGRIEYIVGADGRVLQKESRDAARKAGATGGKTYSDEFVESFRKKWGSSSGFAAMLGKEDQKVLRQFQKSGGFASKAFADRFEQVLVPRYRQVAAKMIAAFEGLKFDPLNGVSTELQRIFGKTEDVEGAMRKVHGVLDELEATSRMGILDRNSFDVAAVTRFRDELQKVFDTGNWEMLSDSQRRIRDELWAQAEAAEEVARVEKIRADYVEAQLTPEQRRTRELLRQRDTTAEMLADRGRFAELTQDETVQLLRQQLQLDKVKESTREWWQETRRVTDESEKLQRHLDAVFHLPGGTLANDFERLARQVRDANAAMAEHRGHLNWLRTGGVKALDFLKGKWEDIDNDIRLVITLIIGAADQIATLGSALGAGILAIGAAGTTALGGVLAFVSTIGTLHQDLSELPPELQDAARAMKDFGSAFAELRIELARGGAAGLEKGWSQLAGTLRDLQPVVRQFGRALGDAFDRLTADFGRGTEGFHNLNLLLQDTTDLLGPLERATSVWARALISGMHQATPLAEDLFGWIERLGTQVLAFTRTDAFGQWVRNSQRLFGDFGELLDRLGRMLNNLVTPASVERTSALLNNLSALTPGLETVLDVFGRLDPIGILVDILAAIGEALVPVHDELGALADVLRDRVFTIIEALTPVIVAATSALQPFIGALAAMIEAVPPQVWSALATAAGLYFTALAAFKGLTSVAGILRGISDAAIGMFDSLSSGKVNAATGAVDKLSSGLGKAGLAGAVVGAAVAVGIAVSDMVRDLSKIEQKATDIVASGGGITSAYRAVQDSFVTFTGKITDFGAVFDQLKAKQDNFLSGSDALWSETQRQADTLQQSFHELDEPLANLAQKSLPEAQKQFAQMATDMGLTREQTLVMLDEMPQLKAVFEEAAGGAAGLATENQTLDFALRGAKAAADDGTVSIRDLGGTAKLSEAQVKDLDDAIRNFGDTQITTMEATADFEQSIADLTTAFGENGASLDLTTEAGRNNQKSLLDSIQAAKDMAAATYDQTEKTYGVSAATDAANGVLATQKQRLIDTIKQFDNAGYQAGLYNDYLDALPDNITTVVHADTAGAEGAINNFIRTYNGKQINVIVRADGSFNLGGGRFTNDARAAGGIATRPTYSLWGEAGPEAIVPLRRPLSQVDPSVRALSAFAQGLKVPQAQPQLVLPASRAVTFSPGSIVVQGATNPERVALNVANRVAERVAG